MQAVGALLLLLAASLCVKGDVSLPGIFGDDMVLQRAPQRARVWGFASAGEQVHVSIAGQTIQLEADDDGHFYVDLRPVEAGGPHDMIVEGEDNTVTVQRVMFGDVYLCSGQSNMCFTMNSVFNSTTEMEDAANYPNLHLFTVNQSYANDPQYDLGTEANYQWAISSDAAVNGSQWDWFSGVCYFFGRQLSRQYPGLPIGLITSCFSGSIIQSWSSPDALAHCNASDTLSRHPTPAEWNLADPWNYPYLLWNAMIHPLINMTFAGVTWYQGESNTGDDGNYACQFPAMITDWRLKFRNPMLPFYFVQLAAFPGLGMPPFAPLRWAQTYALQLPMVGMATAHDLGDPGSPPEDAGPIHPRNKQDVGRRLALLAFAFHFNPNPFFREKCEALMGLRRQLLLQYKPDFVFLTSAYYHRLDQAQETLNLSRSQYPREFELIRSLAKPSTRIVIIADGPKRPHVPVCLSEHGDPRRCNLPRSPISNDYLEMERRVAAENPGVTFIDTSEFFCTNATCPSVVGHYMTSIDTDHISFPYANYICPLLLASIKVHLHVPGRSALSIVGPDSL